MKNLKKCKDEDYYNPDEQLYSPEELAKFRKLDDHEILLHFKQFLEASIPYLIKVCAASPVSDAWDNFSENNYSTLVHDVFSAKYSMNNYPFHKYGFNLHCYRKINHIECFISGDEMEVFDADHAVIKIKSEALKYIGLAFIKFTRIDYDWSQMSSGFSYSHICAEIFDRETGYTFDDERYNTIFIPINKTMYTELVMEDYDQAEHEFYKKDKIVSIKNNNAFKKYLIE